MEIMKVYEHEVFCNDSFTQWGGGGVTPPPTTGREGEGGREGGGREGEEGRATHTRGGTEDTHFDALRSGTNFAPLPRSLFRTSLSAAPAAGASLPRT